MTSLLKEIRKLKNKNSFFSQVATLTSGTVVAQIILVLSAPILTRLYTPAEMGVLASLTAIVGILGVVAAGRYDLAVVLPDNDRDALLVALVGVLFAAGLASLTLVAFGLFGHWINPIVGLGDLHRFWPLLIAPMVFFVGVEQVLQRLLIRRRRYGALATTSVVQQGSVAALKIGAGFLGAGTPGLVTGAFMGHIVRTGGLLVGGRSVITANKREITFAGLHAQAWRYRKFPLVSSWSGFLNTASTQLPVILFASLFSPAVAGFYALSHRILKMPMSLVGGNIGQVFLERAARARDDKAELARLTSGLYGKMLLFGTLGMSVVTFYGDLLFPLVFGPDWVEAGRFAQWISVWLIFVFAASPLSSLFSVLERQGEGLVWNSVLLASRLAIILVGSAMLEHAVQVMAGYSIIGAVVWLALSVRIMALSGVPALKTMWLTVRTVAPVIVVQFVISIFLRGLFL
ncbi:hypothetical protein AU468_13535 [Alkalispirochaeta sphaeroplastigenens]|uniref:Polysaccharide biosynthesis protein n=1 Tax=Alkalispirochaeta sphaeroplastigenens TaxID=1187066 RepID=A0A2S4JFT0_9SPIO|nr:oligosaccharide flippase family protein [Alkalispirochaeta sphaeroplastigenens]POQ98372.1 hypothetical protein AU468_13535 [Alkalispirochaeta sphaeroplastigenens]